MNILLLNTEEYFIGGAETHVINLYKKLLKKNINSYILVAKNSKLEKLLIKENLNYYTYRKFRFLKNVIQPNLYWTLKKIIKQKNINIVHGNIEREGKYLRKISQKNLAKTFMTRHVPYNLKEKYTKNIPGFIGVSPKITEYIKQENINKNFNIKLIDFIPPFFNEEKILNLNIKDNKFNFFKNNFNINIKNCPIIISVAVITENKNQKLIIKALDYLINKKNKLTQLIIVGTGDKTNLIKLAQDLKILEYIYFLDFTDKIPDLLYFSDIKILASKQEAFSIALLEAGLSKKPLICASNTGAQNTIVINNQTGLIFENNNLASLIEKIEILLDNPELRIKMGEQAYINIITNYSGNKILNKQIDFYNKILS